MKHHLIPNPVDHLPVTDALLRFAAGADSGNPILLESAFTEEAEVDFSSCGESLGLEFGCLFGRSNILQFVQATSQSQVTSHVVSNARVERTDAGACLWAMVDAVHLTREDRPSRFQMMNGYSVELIWQEDLWRISRMRISNVWHEGDPQTLLFRKEQHAPGA